MKVLLSWLREFAPDLGGDPFELGDVMSSLGLCCEDVVVVGGNLDGIVAARVLALRPHPAADRIQLVDVDLGDGDALQICCGAFNMAVGDVVPLATLGTTMPDGMEIARRKMRGEWSNGMLCSSRELQLGDDHDGIWILPADVVAGTPFAEAMGIERDVLYDLDLTPNRPDAFSIAGVARDLAAKLGVAFQLPEIDLPALGAPVADSVTVEIEDPDLCGRFVARVLDVDGIGPTDPTIARRLTLLGMRPISTIVDISNYVMLELGQPSHTFDLATVHGRHLRVRRARDGETLVTLDGQTRELVATDGIIADGDDTAVSIAGVMGGASTEISERTTEVLVEAAWWDQLSIVRTSTRLGLRSEASGRFEKGVDTQIQSLGAARVCQLAVAAGATVRPGEIVVEGNLPDRSPILVRTGRVNALLGSSLTRDEIAGYLDPIGFTATPTGEADLSVSLPTWRLDSTAEIDVVEEVARHHGYDRLGKTVPVSSEPGHLTSDQQCLRVVRDVLVANGLVEVTPMPFLAPGTLGAAGLRTDAIVVSNPLAAEESVLRTALLPGIVATLGYNAAHRSTGLGLFEVGRCYAAPTGARFEQVEEWDELGVALGGSDATSAVGVVRLVVGALGLAEPVLVPAEVAGLHPTRAATIAVAGVVVGEVGEVDPATTERAGIDERVGWLRLDLSALLAIERPPHVVAPVSKFPSSDIDLAFVVPDAVIATAPIETLRAASDLVVDARLFDVFRSASVGEGRRSLAYAVRLQAQDRTLTDAEVGEVRAALIAAATTAHHATLRT